MIEEKAVMDLTEGKEPLLIAMGRIRRMEAVYDALRADPARADLRRELTQYYENGRWLRDYQLDEAGLLPGDLKRGVLSQDGVYDLLNETEE